MTHDNELEQQADLAVREALERRRQVRGLLWMAFAVLCFELVRFGLGRAFLHGWWRLW